MANISSSVEVKLVLALLSTFCVFGACSGSSPTFTAANTSYTEVNSCVSLASDGDTINIPSGSSSWASSLDLGTKAITLHGAGIGSTNITNSQSSGYVVSFTASSTASTRITNISLLGLTYDKRGISGGGDLATKPFRIDHCDLQGSGNAVLIKVDGMAPGLIDHNSLQGGDAAEMIHNEANNDGVGTGYSRPGWNDLVTPGSYNAVYIEDNTFTKNDIGNPAYFWGTSAVQSFYGGRTVMRFNTNTMAQFDQHGTIGAVGTRWWEIYHNTYALSGTGPNWDPFNDLRAGSGVNFGNTRSGPSNDGNEEIDLREEDSGYPADYQIGRGQNGILYPAYIWDNPSSVGVNSHSANVVANRDFYCSHPTDSECVATGSFDGSAGVGVGLNSSKPATCTTGVAYWSTDEGEWWAANAGADGRLYKCTATNTWTLYYTPFTYPYPLDGNGLPNPSGGSTPPSRIRSGKVTSAGKVTHQ